MSSFIFIVSADLLIFFFFQSLLLLDNRFRRMKFRSYRESKSIARNFHDISKKNIACNSNLAYNWVILSAHKLLLRNKSIKLVINHLDKKPVAG